MINKILVSIIILFYGFAGQLSVQAFGMHGELFQDKTTLSTEQTSSQQAHNKNASVHCGSMGSKNENENDQSNTKTCIKKCITQSKISTLSSGFHFTKKHTTLYSLKDIHHHNPSFQLQVHATFKEPPIGPSSGQERLGSNGRSFFSFINNHYGSTIMHC